MMGYTTFRTSVLDNFANYLRKYPKASRVGAGTYNHRGEIKPYSHILADKNNAKNIGDNFICATDYQTIASSRLHFHRLAHHLNSSQIMCMNFFIKLIDSDQHKDYLLTLISTRLHIPTEGKTIKDCFFEYEPCSKEKTNFDFYVRLSDGTEIFWEIKYTEKDFAKISKTARKQKNYKDKFSDIYASKLKSSCYLGKLTESEFFDNYQIYRNISYIQGPKQYCVFLFPFANTSLDNQINKIVGINTWSNVKCIDWKDIYNLLTAIIKNGDPTTKSYYTEFYDKYLKY
ncbi:MAG: hypothetical protein LBN34_06585 [Clostridiales Family XIII bacterium]|jgi:hypothetical protein|nr:hypothetical protein [Clostridiales Family XIII bacterium]